MSPVLGPEDANYCQSQIGALCWCVAIGRIDICLSPHVVMGGPPIDHKKHCKVPFGAYVQACNENNPTNTNAPRTVDAIYLRPLNDVQGGHGLMDLNSGRLITRRHFPEIPITSNVIKAVETMASKQGFV